MKSAIPTPQWEIPAHQLRQKRSLQQLWDGLWLPMLKVRRKGQSCASENLVVLASGLVQYGPHELRVFRRKITVVVLIWSLAIGGSR
jgi:hypothetical protein